VPEIDPNEFAALLERVKQLEAELARKDQIIAALQKRLFGSQSERLDPDQLELLMGEEVLGKPEELPETGDEACAPEEENAKRRSRRTKAELFPRNLMVVIDKVLVPEEVEASPEHWIEIGEEHHDELEVVRPQLYWRRVVRKKYKSKLDRYRAPVMAPAPEPSLPGTLCGPSLAAQILTEKYEDHLPHHRQTKRLKRQHDVEIGRQTLNTWTHAAAAHLGPVGEAIKTELFEAEVIGADETPMNYLNPGCGKTSLGYLWTYLDPQRGTVYYDWRLGRGHDCLVDILGLDKESAKSADSPRIIQCDGFSAYRALAARYEGIQLGGCLAHIRRKFYEAKEQDSKVVLPILTDIRELYRIERWLRKTKAPPECRMLVRRAHSRPIVESLHEKILTEREKHLPRSKLGEAINYALNQWEPFTRYLEEGKLEIDNNLVENAIRPAKLGLKNYLFIGSAEAGSTTALIYTLLANCKAHDLDPEVYLAEVIKRLPANPTDEEAAALTPAKLADELRPVPAAAAA
jgi:transposase